MSVYRNHYDIRPNVISNISSFLLYLRKKVDKLHSLFTSKYYDK